MILVCFEAGTAADGSKLMPSRAVPSFAARVFSGWAGGEECMALGERSRV